LGGMLIGRAAAAKYAAALVYYQQRLPRSEIAATANGLTRSERSHGGKFHLLRRCSSRIAADTDKLYLRSRMHTSAHSRRCRPTQSQRACSYARMPARSRVRARRPTLHVDGCASIVRCMMSVLRCVLSVARSRLRCVRLRHAAHRQRDPDVCCAPQRRRDPFDLPCNAALHRPPRVADRPVARRPLVRQRRKARGCAATAAAHLVAEREHDRRIGGRRPLAALRTRAGPGADVGGGDPSSTSDVGRSGPSPGADVAGVS
jgi:hypothetical protein